MYQTYREKALAAAVIKQAVDDLKSQCPSERWAAEHFLKSPDLDFWASSINVDSDVIRERTVGSIDRHSSLTDYAVMS